MINRIISRKNRTEKGFRALDLNLIPHSNDDSFSIHFFVRILMNSGILIINIAIRLMIIKYSINISI